MTERELLQRALDHIEGLPGDLDLGAAIRAYLAEPARKYQCIEPGCSNTAGTAWSNLWCQSCDAERRQRIGNSLRTMLEASTQKCNKV